MPFEYFGNNVLGIALTLPRITAAFLALPLLSSSSMPPLVRNSFFVSLAILVFPLASAAAPYTAMGDGNWPMVIVKELFVGLAIGFTFGIVFWAIGAAGNLIDAKVGTTMASVVDPLAGHQTSLTGAFLTQFAAWLFMASGAFTIFLDVLLTSYGVWPVNEFLPKLHAAGEAFFINQFSTMMTIALLIAAPALVIMSLVDIGFGLINRYAQQLNVFQLALPIKSWIATWIVLLMLGVLVQVVLQHIAENKALLGILKSMIG
ncbi:type III secretion system export apparatus subunit SctT [Dokdonella sp. MW10]|uniref:type III secretion system export apparatus subunit SctT n=1 Tax=Dokdonella sp. MW10 TaxID=2992926 RepID=UPI003F812327